jgi:hypothetical protein
MGVISGDEPMWQIRGIKRNGHERLQTFSGPRAFSDATECFDQMKADKQMWELWLMRLNDSVWEFQELIRRDAQGNWVNIPFDASVELAPGELEEDEEMFPDSNEE